MAIVARGLGQGLFTGVIVAFGLGITNRPVDVVGHSARYEVGGWPQAQQKVQDAADDDEFIELVALVFSEVL